MKRTGNVQEELAHQLYVDLLMMSTAHQSTIFLLLFVFFFFLPALKSIVNFWFTLHFPLSIDPISLNPSSSYHLPYQDLQEGPSAPPELLLVAFHHRLLTPFVVKCFMTIMIPFFSLSRRHVLPSVSLFCILPLYSYRSLIVIF